MTLRGAWVIPDGAPLEIHVRDGTMTRPCATSILLLFVFSAYAWPQSEIASVLGAVTDPSGAVIAGAQVTILNESTGLKRDSSTDLTGQYRIAGLPIGNYSVRVQKEGFQTQVREGITLTSCGQRTEST